MATTKPKTKAAPAKRPAKKAAAPKRPPAPKRAPVEELDPAEHPAYPYNLDAPRSPWRW